jgi:hypothetical protein
MQPSIYIKLIIFIKLVIITSAYKHTTWWLRKDAPRRIFGVNSVTGGRKNCMTRGFIIRYVTNSPIVMYNNQELNG